MNYKGFGTKEDFKLRSQWNKYSKMEGTTAIHEKDYSPLNCCLCGKHMKSIHETHNPYPLTPKCYAKEAEEGDLKHRCCNQCNNEKVNPARKDLMEKKYGNEGTWVQMTTEDAVKHLKEGKLEFMGYDF